jgi:DNA-binding response OmpR family regulator
LAYAHVRRTGFAVQRAQFTAGNSGQRFCAHIGTATLGQHGGGLAHKALVDGVATIGAGALQFSTQLSMGDLDVDLLARKATRAQQRLLLTAKEFNLLTLSLRRRGQILSRTTLAEQVWDMNFDSDTNVVEVAVRRLRAKLDDPFEAKLLHTVRGMGYVLEERAA